MGGTVMKLQMLLDQSGEATRSLPKIYQVSTEVDTGTEVIQRTHYFFFEYTF